MKPPVLPRLVGVFAVLVAGAIVLSLVLLASPQAQAAVSDRAGGKAVAVETSLRAATVYPDRAVVSRVAKLAVAEGTNEFVVEGLPATLMDESVQVAARGTVSATLLDISARTVFASAEPDARVKGLEDQLAELRRDERALNDQNAVLDAQRALLGQIEKAYTTPVAGGSGSTPPGVV